MQIGDLLTELVADVGLLSEGVGSPDGNHRDHGEHDGATYSTRAGAHIARGNYGFAVSHAASLVDVRVDEAPTITKGPGASLSPSSAAPALLDRGHRTS